MKGRRSLIRTLPLLLLFLWACGGGKSNPEEATADRYDRGTIHISCDESFRPVMDEQVRVYEAQYPQAHIVVDYKPEAECLKDLAVDSVRLVLATRGLTPGERQLIIDSLKTDPESRVIARDLIAVVVHPSARDTFFSMQEIRDLLSGSAKENLIPVFDGVKATSTVRFMLDSVLRGGSLSPRAVAANGSREVIEYVSRVPNAVGFVGFSWIGNLDDTSQSRLRQGIRLAWVESTDSANAYVLPSQFFIYTRSYPMVRDLVYVLKERHEGLGHAFAHFLTVNDKGQLIFRRSYLMPAIAPNYVRDARLQKD